MTSISTESRKQEPVSTARQVDSHAVTKRLQSELMSLMSSAEPGVSAFPDGDSLFSWIGELATCTLCVSNLPQCCLALCHSAPVGKHSSNKLDLFDRYDRRRVRDCV